MYQKAWTEVQTVYNPSLTITTDQGGVDLCLLFILYAPWLLVRVGCAVTQVIDSKLMAPLSALMQSLQF